MPKKRKSRASTAKSEKLWIQETLKRLHTLQQTRGSEPVAAPKAAPKPARPASGRKKK